MFVTTQTEQYDDLLGELADALAAVGVAVDVRDGALGVDGTRFVVAMVDRAHPTPAALAQIIADAPARRPAVVVADRISDAGREILRRAGWGWLDRRGHVRLWTNGVRIETPVPGMHEPAGGPHGNPWTTVGFEVALAALLEPTRVVAARHVAAVIGRSVGAAHELIGRLANVGLIGNASRLPLLPDLFWETAAHWPDDDWLGLPVGIDEIADRLGADRLVRVDERAATFGGARIAAAGDLPARAYVRSDRALRRVRSLADRNVRVQTWLRVAPVSFLPENPDVPPDPAHPWQVAHPLVCALRLAADPARGREIVENWGIVPTGVDA
ncbi:MAG: hypothetical protein JST73_13105 [Actinobacteria bacterium]|nr:hypothetical protein [Actinomycetota bacterium]